MQQKNDTLGLSNTDVNNLDRTNVYESRNTGNTSQPNGTGRARANRTMDEHEHTGNDAPNGKGEPTKDALCNVSGYDLKLQVDIPIQIYRHTFTQEFMDEMYSFSKIHQYDDRHSFKEAWSLWTEENNDLVLRETRKLVNEGYDGNILEKMFKSARYYFRKKSTEKKAPLKRRNYISMSKELLESIDNHIYESIKNPDYKPSHGYNDFYEKNIKIIENEIQNWVISGQLNEKEIMIAKIKKTYKNRYFVITNKNKISVN